MTILPLAYSTNGFTERTLIEALKEIAEIGYQGVELLGDRPHWTLDTNTEANAHELRRVIQDLDLKVSNVNGNTAMYFWPKWMPETLFEPSLSHRDRSVRLQRLEATFALMDWAKLVGAPRVSVTSGRCPGLSTPEVETAHFIESLHTLCEYAEQLDLQLSIEYEPGLLIERWVELAQVIQRVDHPCLGANLDLGHARCAGEDPIEAIRGLKGKIWNIHIEDIMGLKHYHLIPGEGDMPLALYMQELCDLQYQGMLTVELYTYANHPQKTDREAASQAFTYLSQLKAQLSEI
jgi:fructoselysine 3-epimerase